MGRTDPPIVICDADHISSDTSSKMVDFRPWYGGGTGLSSDSITPFYGTLAERSNITKLINSKLQRCAIRNHFYYFDAYQDFSLKDGSFNMPLGDRTVHVHPKYSHLVKERFLDFLLIILAL